MLACIWQHPVQGTIHVTMPAYEDRMRPPGVSDDEFRSLTMERTFAQYGVPSGTPYSLMEGTDVDAQHWEFRDAWEDTNCAVNMTKARVVHLAEIRRVRNAELVKEDVTFMRAVEAGDTDAQATIATKKQALRDLPATFDITTGVDTPEKLKAKWPTELPARE